MEKIYTYKNAIIKIKISDEKHKKIIREATETFLRRIIEEESRINGNCNTSRSINEKQILDK